MRIARALLFTLALVVLGCGDDDANSDNGATSNNVDADAGTSGDAGNATTPDAPDELFGTVCPAPDAELLGQDCSLVDQDCTDGVCEKRIVLDAMQMPTGFAIVCGGDPVETTLTEGDTCGVGIGECPVNMVCKRFAGESESVCRKWCRMADAYGCTADQACVPSSDLEPVFGVCADSCP